VPDGDSRIIVLTPEDSGSPFKVYKNKPTSSKQRTSAESLSGLGKACGMTRCSADRSLIGEYADINEMDSIQDKPSMSLGINPSKGERTEHLASECCVSEDVNRSRSEESISTAGKEDTLKPQSKEKLNASRSKDNILVFIIKEALKLEADERSVLQNLRIVLYHAAKRMVHSLAPVKRSVCHSVRTVLSRK
jgi:hypothetical protein